MNNKECCTCCKYGVWNNMPEIIGLNFIASVIIQGGAWIIMNL
ncbi:MAG TPA: hypothetical protein VIG73_07260 [Cerasibacillus sp.]